MDVYCKNYKRVAIGHHAHKDAIFIRLRCKQWTCEYCAKVNRLQWQKRLIEGAKILGGHWSFWTLTHDIQNRPLLDQRKHLSACWNRLLTQMRRLRSNAKYVRVLEIGKNNTRRMHLHALLNFRVSDLKTIYRKDGTSYGYSNFWAIPISRSGFGMVWDIQNISDYVIDRPHNEQAIYAVSYVTKYMAKQDISVQYPSYTRRFSVSRDWPKLLDDDSFDNCYKWQVAVALNEIIAKQVWRTGRHIVDQQTGDKITFSDFNEDMLFVDPVLYPDRIK